MRETMIAAALLLAGAAPAWAVDNTATFPMNDEVRTGMRNLRVSALSADGKRVLAEIGETTANGALPHLWLLGADLAPRQVTFRTGEKGETNGTFLADGSILFLAAQDGSNALYRLPAAGGEPERYWLAKDKAGKLTARWNGTKPDGVLAVGGYALSHDGRTAALWADDADPDGERRAKDDGYAHDVPDHRTRLYLVDLAMGKARQVAFDGVFASADWSYDDADVMLGTDPSNDETGPDAAWWRVDPATLKATPVNVPKTAFNVAWLPGRTRLVYTDQCADDAPPGCTEVIVKDVANGVTRNLTRDLDGTLYATTVRRDGDLDIAVSSHTLARLGRLNVTTRAVTWIDAGQPVIGSIATNSHQTAWAYVATGSAQPPMVKLLSQAGGAAVTLAAPAVVPDKWPRVPAKPITWQNEGLTIEGLLYMPEVAAGAKVPLVVNVHGGPTGTWEQRYDPLAQMLVAEGWAVLLPNIRGSTGYGAKFTAANKNDLGGADFRDVIAGVDAVLKDHLVDAGRMALIGYSYGGEMAGFAVGKTDRFKAIVAGAPVINQISEYGTEDGSFYDRWWYGRPWVNFADAWRQSPLATVANAKTPFLLLQGEADSTDPLGQSLEMYRALKQTGAPVALVRYPREGHGDTGANFAARPSREPWHGVDLRRRMFGLLRAAFAGEKDPLAAARKDVP